MNLKDRLETVIMVLLVSYGVSGWVIKGQLEAYHCQPITTHNTLEDAKAQVVRYQAMVRG